MNSKEKYEKLKESLLVNVFNEDAINSIDKMLRSEEISLEEAYKYLIIIEKEGMESIPKPKEFEWKELIKVIDDSEKRLKRTTKFQFYLALCELPVIIIFLFIAIYFNWFKQDFGTFLTASAGVLGTVLTHTYLILQFHQQATTAIDRLVEKKVGIFFLHIEVNSSHGKIDPDKLINAGTQMFLGHHVKPAEPLTADDLHGKK